MAKLFKDIAGQKRAVSMLSAHLNSGNLSHAYLFLGREGTGKERLAREFARYILCDKRADDDCDSCRKFEKGAHPDFIYIKGNEGVKIEDVRGAIERIGLSPAMAASKVCLITKTENMGIEAANALLKTLEEPPADSIIILTGDAEKRLLETIISRSQVVRLNPVSESEISRILEKEFNKSEIEEIISLSEGSIGEAKKMLQNGEALADKKKIIADVGTLVTSESLVERFKIIEGYDNRKRLREFFEVFARAVFNSIQAHFSGSRVDLSTAIPSDISLERKVALAKKILKTYRNLDYNVNLRIAIEEMMIKDVMDV
jgi:DNA polymerase-3 subunit delta'